MHTVCTRGRKSSPARIRLTSFCPGCFPGQGLSQCSMFPLIIPGALISGSGLCREIPFLSSAYSPASSSSTLTSSISLNFFSILTSGIPPPVSHFDTALFVTPSRSASSFWVSPIAFLLSEMNCPVLFSILPPPLMYDPDAQHRYQKSLSFPSFSYILSQGLCFCNTRTDDPSPRSVEPAE